MATNFPTSLDSLTNPATSDQLNSPSHAAQHANVNDAIEQLEAKVGVDGSTVTTSHAYKIAQLESDIQNSAGDFIPLSVLGQPSGPAELNADGNLIVPENKIIIEGATADAHELTLQAPDVTSDITVTLPNASGTLALTTDVSTAITNLVSSAPATLDTLNELATALGNDANFATTTATSIGNKVSKAGGDIIQSSLSTVIPLVVKGAASQSANLQEWQDSAGNLLGRITSTGVTSFYGGSNIFPGDVRAGTSSYLTAALSVASRVATESGLVVRGFASQSANLQEWQNSTGTVVANVNSTGDLTTPNIGIGALGGIYNVSAGSYITFPAAGMQINPYGAAKIGLVIKGAASQTANLLEFQNSSGTAITYVTASGHITAASAAVSTLYSGGQLQSGTMGYFNATTFAPSVSPIVVRGTTSQSADLTQWQNSAGTVLANISSSGSFNNTGDAVMLNVFRTTDNAKIAYFKGASFAVRIGSEVGQGAQIEGVDTSNGITSYQPIRLGGSTTALHSGGSTRLLIGANGNVLVNGFTASAAGLTVKGAASQTANLQEWQNSAGTVRSYIDKDGLFSNTYGAQLSTANVAGVAGVSLSVGGQSGAVANTVLKNSSGATYDFLQFQNSSGTVLSKIDSTGAMFTITPAANTNTTQVATTAYVQTELADLVNSAPATLDTLNELATALGNDASFSTTVTNSIALKAPLASPALTGTPTAPTATAGTNTTQLATTAFVKTEITSSVQPGAVYQTSAPSSPAVGQIWIDSDQDVTTFDSNIIRRKSITATAGQTVFTADLPFIDGFEQVFFNGLLLLKTSDYTTSGGNTVTLTSAAAVSDIVEIVSVTGANSVTTYTQAEVDALLAANTSVAPISISANTNLAAKKRYFVTSASALTLTLPATPALNDEVQIVDASGNALTYNITVARNGKLINGNAGNLIIDVNGGWYTLVFTGNTYGWKVG